MDRARHDRMLRKASKLKGIVKRSAGPRLAAVQRSPVAGSGASSSSAGVPGSPSRTPDQGESLKPVTVLPSPLRPEPDPDALVCRKRQRTEAVDLTQDEATNIFTLPSCFLQPRFFEGGPSLIIPRAESLHIEGLDPSVRQRFLVQDASAVVRLLEMATLYARSAPLSAEAAKLLQEQVKMSASTSDEKDRLLKEQGEELGAVKARLDQKEAALMDVQGQ
ncbi:uncharacterized protein LOC131634929 [Vicia villosa]|uniref:uncharacterized protein LOC131634929 n=1 Tax=Vicia villosa TaxID=3911 RepID=UPI00273B22D9|nr:uncharacterized protein LOC131634929 [Vicia villosa]